MFISALSSILVIGQTLAWQEVQQYTPSSATPTEETIYTYTNTSGSVQTNAWAVNHTYDRFVIAGDPDAPNAPWHSDLATLGDFSIVSSYGRLGELVGPGEVVTHILRWTTEGGVQE